MKFFAFLIGLAAAGCLAAAALINNNTYAVDGGLLGMPTGTVVMAAIALGLSQFAQSVWKSANTEEQEKRDEQAQGILDEIDQHESDEGTE